MDPNYDPKDETHVRPQVGFRLKAGAFDSRLFLKDVTKHAGAYHDAMLLDPKDGEVPGTIRFAWDASRQVVDDMAAYLRGFPYVLRIIPNYGHPIDAA